MLEKSRKSAIIMAGITLLSVLASAMIWITVSTWLRGELIDNLQAIQWSWQLFLGLCLGLPLLLLIFAVLPGAFIIHGQDEAYFGLQGTIRWAIFGILWIVFVLGIRALLPDFDSGENFSGYFLQRVINAVVGLICAFIAFRVAFIGRHPAKNTEEKQT